MAKKWFLVTEGGADDRMYDLFYEESESAVKKRLSSLTKDVRVSPLSERGLTELLGCTKLVGKEDDALVEHPLLLHHLGRMIWING